MQFPPGEKFTANCRRWRLSDIEAYEAALRGEPEPIPRDPADERYLTARQLADRYNVSLPTIWRWQHSSARAAA